MLLSSKISNSVLSYLESRGASLDTLLEETDLPLEFARDPSCWIQAQAIEEFLAKVEREFSGLADNQYGVVELSGRNSHQLRAWGVLDSVLKMMGSAEEILALPEKFLSYFVSPPPPIGALKKGSGCVEFDLPISDVEYPLSARFFVGAFESLPGFFGQDLAKAHWTGHSVKIEWQVEQGLLGEEDLGRNMKPEFINDLVASLEQHQKELEAKNKELLLKNQELEKAQTELKSRVKDQVLSAKLEGLGPIAEGVAGEIKDPIAHVQGNLMRLQDYMIRAQQLVTLLVKQDRMDRQVQNAMKRVDWEFINSEFPKTVKNSNDQLKEIIETVKNLTIYANASEINESQKKEVDLNQVVEKAILSLGTKVPERVRLDRHLLLDRTVSVDPIKMEKALSNIIVNAVDSIKGDGSVRVVTRPKGARAEIEISDTGEGLSAQALENVFTPFHDGSGKSSGLGLSIARSIVKMHEGNVVVSSEPGRGSTFLIDLPN